MPFTFRPRMPEASTREASTSEASTTRPRARLTKRGRIARNVAVPLLLAALVTAGSPGWSAYTIRQGDTLSDIAARYHTTVSKLAQVNRLPGNGNLIIAGRTLRVPSRSGSSASGSTRSGKRYHRVVSGDTLSEIAHRYGVSTETVRRANNIPSSDVVMLGTTLVVPGGTGQRTTSSGNTFAGRTYASHVVNAASRNRHTLTRRNVPSRDGMRSIISAKARANGVSPALALAVSYQESGWNQRSVSVANAVGAMQVIPTTTDWISGVVGRRLDPLNPHDNATTGVVLLRILTRSASSERQAVAAYYQGLKSVREHGMYSDTKRYVANVMYLKRRFS
jgi:N-acetylmuramoyl-L-alanine amidase